MMNNAASTNTPEPTPSLPPPSSAFTQHGNRGTNNFQDQSLKMLSMANAAINGAVGDSLQKSEHALSVQNGFYYRGTPLSDPNIEVIPGTASAKKLTIFVHCVCSNEHIWEFSSASMKQESASSKATDHSTTQSTTYQHTASHTTDYGNLLHNSIGYRPFYYRYNSGCAIASNGELLAIAIDKLLEQLSADIEEIALIGYSMGGLVIKSALAWASQHNAKFLPLVKKSFYLGSPHYGAPLEKIAKVAQIILNRLPFSVAQLIAKIMDSRSQGIKDLGFGDVTPYPGAYWIDHIEHHFVGGTLHSNENHPISFFLGDLLVRRPSALPMKEEGHFFENGIDYCYHLFPGVHHLQLQRNRDVLQYIEEKLSVTTA